MTLKEVTYFTIVCDECGADANDGGEFSAWADAEQAVMVFDDSNEDWSTFDGQHRCPEHNPFCVQCGKDAGPFSGDRDYLCVKCEAENEEDVDEARTQVDPGVVGPPDGSSRVPL